MPPNLSRLAGGSCFAMDHRLVMTGWVVLWLWFNHPLRGCRLGSPVSALVATMYYRLSHVLDIELVRGISMLQLMHACNP